MEYSVYDLIRILVRKWYVVVLTMCVLGGVSTIAARQSYQQALEDYEVYTSQTAPVSAEIGTLTGLYQISYQVTDLSKYTAQAQAKLDFLRKYADSLAGAGYDERQLPSVYDAGEAAYAAVANDFTALLTNSLTMQLSQSILNQQGLAEPPTLAGNGSVEASTGPVQLASHLTVEQLDASTVRLTVAGLDEAACRAVMDAYLQGLEETGREGYSMEISSTQTACDYLAQPVQMTDAALLAQTVMQQPQSQPVFVKIVGTAAAAGFVLGCFGVLLFTFIRDTRPKKSAAEQKA